MEGGQRREPSGEITGVDIGCPNCPSDEASTLIIWDDVVRGKVLDLLASRAPHRLSMIDRNEDGYASLATLRQESPQCGQNGECPFDATLGGLTAEVRSHLGAAGCRFGEISRSARNRQG